MIDTHSHILPGLDDGAKSMEETLGIVRQLHEAGFETVFATPHVMEGNGYISPAEILDAAEQVREGVNGLGIPVEILPGAENYIFPDMAKWAHDGRLLTMGNTGKYILIELPMLEIPSYTEQVFFELQVNGITPVLAHPERYRRLSENPERLIGWLKKGILMQLDLRSLSGKYGPKSKRLAERMLQSDLIHLIGSDAHSVSQSKSSYPAELLIVKKFIGEGRFQEVTLTNPHCIAVGKSMQGVKDYCLLEHNLKTRSGRFVYFFRRLWGR